MGGEENAESGTDSRRTESTSSAFCTTASDMEPVAGELNDNVPGENFNASSKTVSHENGTVDEESAADGVGTSDSGPTAGIVDGSIPKIDSLGSVRSGTGTRLDS